MPCSTALALCFWGTSGLQSTPETLPRSWVAPRLWWLWVVGRAGQRAAELDTALYPDWWHRGRGAFPVCATVSPARHGLFVGPSFLSTGRHAGLGFAPGRSPLDVAATRSDHGGFPVADASSKGETLPDLDWAGRGRRIESHQRCRVPINPVTEPQVWYADLIARRFVPPPLQTRYPIRFGEQIELLGYDFSQTPQL